MSVSAATASVPITTVICRSLARSTMPPGFLISEMLGCEIHYKADGAPDVVPAQRASLEVDADQAFRSAAAKRYERLRDQLKRRHGRVLGDINWGGVLNVAMDLRGQEVFLDMLDNARPGQGAVPQTGRGARPLHHRHPGRDRHELHLGQPQRAAFPQARLPPFGMLAHDDLGGELRGVPDADRREWSGRHRPFGIHHCGRDPHRFAASYAKLPRLDFLDLGWGGDVALLRRHLPHTFFNIRLDPVSIVRQTPAEIRETIRRLVHQSDNPWLTGVCCVNLDHTVSDAQINAIFDAVAELRREYQSGGAQPA